MPILIAQGKKLSRQFIPEMDPNYGYIGRMTDEEYASIGGLLWYNELMQVWQLRSIHMRGPRSCGTEIRGKTMVFEVEAVEKQFHRERVYAFGVSFGGNSPYNNGQVSESNDSIGYPFEYATLEALLDGFDQVEEITKHHKSINDIKVRIGQPWLVGVLAWGRDLERTAHRYYHKVGDVQPLLPLVDAVEARLNELEDRGLSIEFWLIDDADDASVEANLALNRYGANS